MERSIYQLLENQVFIEEANIIMAVKQAFKKVGKTPSMIAKMTPEQKTRIKSIIKKIALGVLVGGGAVAVRMATSHTDDHGKAVRKAINSMISDKIPSYHE